MLRFFDLFGKSAALGALDDALRDAGVHPALVPEPVKLTILRLNKQAAATAGKDTAFAEAAQLLAYCMLGPDHFARANSPKAAERAGQRLDIAIEAGDSRDAKTVLLALHSGLITDEVAERLDIEDR